MTPQQSGMQQTGLRLPPGFVIGTATAAAQIEGGVAAGGRTPSVWDRFSDQPGRIIDGSSTAVTADHFHRHAEDVRLMADLGVDAYRFSLSWTRLQPNGRGSLATDGVAFYERLLDELQAAGIRPFVTISHWDLPEEYEHGWLDRDTAARLGEFAGLVGERFGDRVDSWITINEPATVTLNGYALGLHAPGQALLFDALPTVHHQLLGHGLAVQALRATGVRGRIGITNVHTPVVPAGDSPEDAMMAALFDVVHNRVFADPVLLGHYPQVPDELSPLFGAFAEVPVEDLVVISQPLDFYGLNYYMPTRVAAGAGTGESPDGTSQAMADLPFRLEEFDEYPRTGFGWPIAPEAFTRALAEVQERYGQVLPPVYITENGASFADAVDAATGAVDDQERIDYLAGHLDAALSAVTPGAPAEGLDLRGLFVWSLMDNWEWAAGFTQRFGLVHVDFETLERTPKASFRWLAGLLRARGES
ncbi:GH1 family beta-glucosidase [Microbacterium sp. ARD32]|uniref:GH1 family beta-glucosidase n=1 Tax=Microbacterium sp. ARD32 TaxID=2962577 RepID=UPI0028823376|nr:GH1 family beta-glucosidase [Microbacterium sp. ARD32]MDT0157957.1 GH1 family beta-glucosidase [Microbacterium sp. ARD32]